MKRILPAILCMGLMAVSACRPLDLERGDVPIAWGMRYDTPAAVTELNPNLSALRQVNMRQLMLELPLRADSAGLPMVPPLPMAEFASLLGRYKVGLNVAFAPTTRDELFPEGRMTATPEAWFAALRTCVDSTLDQFRHYRLNRVVIGSNLQPTEQYPDHWIALMDSLRNGRDCFVSYGGDPDVLRKLPFLHACDEIAVDYPPSAENPRPFCRAQNQLLSRMADSLRKPIYIFRANILGEDQAEQLRNRLRYWADGVNLRGVAVNSLYAKIPLRDSTSYYGMADNPDVDAFLEEYRKRED